MRISWPVGIILGMALMSGAAWAHHAAAADFDVKSLILLQGTVRKIEWINPHAWLHLEVVGADGRKVIWRIEGASMNAYQGRQFPKESVKNGVKISITVYPAKDGSHTADGGTITFKSGKRVFFGGSAPVDGLDGNGRPCIFHVGTDCRM